MSKNMDVINSDSSSSAFGGAEGGANQFEASKNKFTKKGVIKTMPDYFRSGKYLKYRNSSDSINYGNSSLSNENKNQTELTQQKSTTSIKQNKFVLIGILVFILIFSVGGYFGYNFYYKNNNTGNTSKLEEERLKQEELRRQREEQERLANDEQQLVKEKQEQVLRDEKRFSDIMLIQNGLEKYFEKVKKYPDNLIGGDSISYNGDVFLDSVPIDPVPTNNNYAYLVAPSDNLSYTLGFTLENGVLGLSKGLFNVSSEKQLQTDGTFKTLASKRKENNDAQILLSSLDTDQDGLTDIEETLLYTTNMNEFDSDKDSYSDKQEVLNLYNPSGTAPIRLIDSQNVNEYKNEAFGYSIYYPKKWVYKTLDGSDREVIFTSTTGEFIEVLVVENTQNLTLEKWYETQYGKDSFDKTQIIFTNKNKLQGLRSPDRRTVYFTKSNSIFIITHNIGNKELVDYGVTFEIMLKSFNFLEPKTQNKEKEENKENLLVVPSKIDGVVEEVIKEEQKEKSIDINIKKESQNKEV